ncbi:MAG: DUF3300 domain-containing protein [Rheinheimera sp.]|nr:MAG: DUF3300 domain-containing protein [Rheinheimera sp.]
MSCRVPFLSAITLALVTQFPAVAADKQAAAKATQQLSQPAAATAKPQAAAKKQFSQAELDQMLAPVALYPDTVLSHVLIAATYPLEIIKATRWLSSKPGMTSEQALKAAENESWDPSVRALVAFPPLLTKMNNELDWTQKLGDAFLVQEKQVMATVQKLREKAYTAGNLTNQEHLRVERKEKVIVIEPARPEVIYVPVYDTRVVYGDWWWRSYPPVHWPYPTGYRRHASFYWGAGVQVAPNFYFSTFYWPRNEIVVIHHHDYRPRQYYRSHDIYQHEERRHWRHNPEHRHGVVYQAGYEPVRETRGETWRYEDQGERRRWAAEKRQDNNVAMPGDQQIITQADPDHEQLRRQQQDREQVFAQPVNELNSQTEPVVVMPDQGDTTTPVQPVAETVDNNKDGIIEQPVFEQPVHETPVTDMRAPVDQIGSPEQIAAPEIVPQPEPQPVYEQPQPVEPMPEPVTEQPITELPVYQQPEPVYQQPEPVYQQPEPVYQQPEPVYQQPEPVYQQPEPVYQQPEPVYQQPEPVYQQPEPVYQQPEPVYQQPEPVYQQPEPVYQQPEPVSQPVIEQSGIQ